MPFLSPCFEARSSIHNAVNSAMMNAKPFSQLNLMAVSRDVQLPYFFNLLIRQFTKTIFLAVHWMLRTAQFSTLVRIITHVIRSGADKKVGGIHTRWIVSLGTIMADLKPIWDWSKMQNPTRPMRQLHSLSSPAASNQPVSSREFPSCPQPTGFSVFNLRKKTVRETDIKSLLFQILRCNVRHSSVLCRFGLLARPALLFSLNRSVLSTLFFSLLLAFSAWSQPAPINRRALVLTGLASAPPSPPLANLILWLKADAGVYQDATTLATNGASVHHWLDQTTNHYDVTNINFGSFDITNQLGTGPLGSNALRFPTDTRAFLINTGYAKTNNCMVLAIAQALSNDNLNPGHGIFANVNDNGNSNPTPPLYWTYWWFGQLLRFQGKWGPTTLTLSTFYKSSLLLSNDFNVYMRVNGAYYTNYVPAGIVTAWPIVGFCVGAPFTNNVASDVGLGGRLTELLVYEGLSMTSLTNAETYLFNKYGL